MVKEVKKHWKDEERERGSQKVTGIFRFHEVKGGCLKFVFKRWKDVPTEQYEFYDGKVYTIPLEVAEHINNNCGYDIHAHCKDEEGKTSIKVGRREQRCSFDPIGFSDLKPANTHIYTATNDSLS